MSDIEGIHQKVKDEATSPQEIKHEIEPESYAELVGLCKAMAGIYDMAYVQYMALVDDACNRKMTEKEVEHLLDNLLDFACEDRCLSLYKKLCRKYYSYYPETIAEYVESYREMWE